MPRPRILVADDLAPEGLAILREAGEVTEKKGLSPAALGEALPGFQALVVRSATQVDAGALAGARDLLVIGRAGIGVDNIDVEAATARGIAVMNTPEAGATTTAELAIAHLFALARHVPAADRSMKEGKWEKSRFSGIEITGKTLGLIGLGRIGRVVADRALGLSMRVLAFDPFVTPERVPRGVTLVELDRLLAESDFASVHVPLSDETRGLIGAREFAGMKPGARLIHCARGGIVDEAALVEALASKRLAAAAIDVFETEPLPADHALRRLPNVVLTPHLGASTEDARRAVAIDVARQVSACLRSGIVLNGVNVPHVHPAEEQFLAPFLSLAERLASLVVQMESEAERRKLSRLLVQTQGEVGEKSQRPLVVAALVGALRWVTPGRITPVNAELEARTRSITVSSERETHKRDFVNLVRVEARFGERLRTASGTLIGRRHLRLVELDEFLIDAIPEGHLLVTRHADRPGMVGRLGTLLGDAHVNLSRVQVGVPRERAGEAVGIFNLDQAVPPALLERLRRLEGLRELWTIEL